MIQIREITTGEIQIVETLDGYDMELYEDMGEPPSGALNGSSYWDGSQWVEDWSRIDAMLHAKIDASAGEHRKRFITTSPGQEMTYLHKEKEARAHLAGDPAGPMISTEATARGVSTVDLATEVVTNADFWAYLGGKIEGVRLAAKAQVSAATIMEDKLTAAEVTWPES